MSNGNAVDPEIEVGSFRTLGFGCLRRVEQKILRYEAGEVAHIENVLKGEERTRDHRRLKRTEEMLRIEEEKTEEIEKDLQSTDRFELQKETEETLSEEISLDSSLTINAYGPTVDTEASVQFAFRNASERSERTAVNYARETIERTVNKIQERVREERVRTTIEEFEEKNIHYIKNAGDSAQHIVGIYRWVDKVYEAQVFDYGWRLLMEFLVPEPAALLRYMLEEHPTEEIEEPLEPVAVDDPSTPEETVPLRPDHLLPSLSVPTENYYQRYVSEYKVLDVKPPPEKLISQAYTFKVPQTQEDGSPTRKRDIQTKKVSVPEGYRATSARILVRLPTRRLRFYPGSGGSYEPDGNYYHDQTWENLTVSIGYASVHFWPSVYTHFTEIDLGPGDMNFVGELAMMIETAWDTSWAVSVEIIFELMDDGLSKWQKQTWDAIMQAYLQQKAEYDEQLRARAVQQGIEISGRNSAFNREVEKTELKRGCLNLLTHDKDPSIGEFGSIKRDDDLQISLDVTALPEIDIEKARAQAPVIQFLEHAFEWQHMMYVFYPYYWTTPKLWPQLQQLQDVDPLHARFLQAGAARVVVPVRPEYENWLNYYVQHGDVYCGADPPGVGIPGFLDIIDELRELQDYDGRDFNATLTVTQGETLVEASPPNPPSWKGFRMPDPPDDPQNEHDENRRIYIDMKPYRIAEVVSETEIRLAEPYQLPKGYQGPATRTDVPFAMGARYLGAPWEVRLPTTLVVLEKRTDTVDDLTFGDS
jgi:hypothetical protein